MAIFFSLIKESKEGEVRGKKVKKGKGGKRRERKGQGTGWVTEILFDSADPLWLTIISDICVNEH